jgi:replicative DNA helicase
LARELNVPVIALSQLSRAVESRTPPIPQLADLRDSGCLTGDTLVYGPTTGQYTPIKDLVGIKETNISTLSPVNWKLSTTPISNAFSTGVKPVFRMVTATGRSIRATANHKFLTVTGWKRFDELKKTDLLATPRILKGPLVSTLSEAKVKLLGHLIGDGCTLPRHVMQYTTRELDIAEEVTKIAIEAFPNLIMPRINKERTWYQVYLPSTRKLTHGVRNPIATWLSELNIFGLRSYEKFVPQVIFSQPANLVALFLKHIWATDGCINVSENPRRHPAVYYASSSPRLAKDVQSLLLRLGITSRISEHPQIGKGRNQYHVKVSGKHDLLRFNALIGAVGARRQIELRHLVQRLASPANTNRDVIPKEVWYSQILPTMKAIGMTTRALASSLQISYNGTALYSANLSRTRADRIASVVGNQELAYLSNSDVYWDKISSIEPDGEEEVFDLTVPNTHNFVAADMIVHNSIEQDADVVMFIYREAYYNKQTDRENITDIQIKKHRNGPIGDIELYFHPEQRRFSNLERFHG